MLLAESLAAMPRVTAQVVPRLLPYLEAGLAPAASAEQYAGALMVATQLASRAPLAPPLTEALLEGVAKGARAPLHAQSLQASLALCQTQAVKTLPGRAFKHLVKLPDLPGHLADLCRGYRAEALSVPLVVALAQSSATHSNYERVLIGVVTEAPLSDVAVTALVQALVALATSGNGKGLDNDSAESITASKILRLVEIKFPTPTSTAVDAVLAAAAGKGDAETSGFLRHVLVGSAAGPMPGNEHCSLGAALDHPNAGLREQALRELKKGGNSSASLRNGSLSKALLRRVVDDHPKVAAAAVALPALRQAVNDDAALFDATVERLASAAAACAGKTPDAEHERAVAKRCVALVIATLATPFADGETGETGARGDADGSQDDSDFSDDERNDTNIGGKTEAGALAGRGAALAFGYLTFSPSTRAVARATIDTAKKNQHPSLRGLRGKRFAKAMESAAVVSPPQKPKKKSSKSEPDPPTVDKEQRALMDASSNRAVIDALAEGLASDPSLWEGTQSSLTMWTRDAWLSGSPRQRATLLLSLRRAAEGGEGEGFTEAGVESARVALWSLLKQEWFGEHGGGAFISDDLPFETPEGSGDGEKSRVGNFQLDFLHKTKPATFRAVAKHDGGVVAALSRSCCRAVCEARVNTSSTTYQEMLHSAFDLVAVSSSRATQNSASKHSLDATMETILQALGDGCVAFLAQKAAGDPDPELMDTENDTENRTAETPRFALELLASRDGDSSKTSGTLAALIVACASSDPETRAAASKAVVALAPASAKKGSSKSNASSINTLWSSLASVADRIGDTKHTSTASARSVTSEALKQGLAGDATGDATRALLQPAVNFVDAFDGSDASQNAQILRLSSRGAAHLVATLRGAGSDSVKSETLAPALTRALVIGTAASGKDVKEGKQRALRSADAAALATEILATYTEKCATDGIGANAWAAFSKATRIGVDAAPAPARVAATALLTKKFVASLPPNRRRSALRSLFVAVAGDPDAGARAAARDAMDALDVHAEDVVNLLESATAATRGEHVVSETHVAQKPAKKTKSSKSKNGTHDVAGAEAVTGAKAVGAAIAALEVMAWKPAVDSNGCVQILVPACRALLAASLDAAEKTTTDDDDSETQNETETIAPDVVAARAAASGGYAQALLLSTLEALASRLAETTGSSKSKKSSKSDSNDDSFWDVPLVVRSVRDAEAGPARDAALSLLAALARADPKGVMGCALEVSAALSHRASDLSTSEDFSSRRALEQALGAVVPAWIAGGLGMDTACDRVIDALPDAPEHRRAGICVAFLRATQSIEDTAKNPGLPVVVTSLLTRTKALETAAEAAVTRRAAKASKRARKEGGALLAATTEAIEMEKQLSIEKSSAWVQDLVATLLAWENATTAVDALVQVSKVCWEAVHSTTVRRTL